MEDVLTVLEGYFTFMIQHGGEYEELLLHLLARWAIPISRRRSVTSIVSKLEYDAEAGTLDQRQ